MSEAIAHLLCHHTMNTEYQALLFNKTWTLVPPCPDMNVIGNKFIFNLKRHLDGSIECYNAHLVAKGFHQTPGQDFSNIFSLVVKSSTKWVVLTVAVSYQWQIIQLDINNAFLNGHLHQLVFMQQPEGFVDPQKPHHVCLLSQALYGLLHAPRARYEKLQKFLLFWRFKNS